MILKCETQISRINTDVIPSKLERVVYMQRDFIIHTGQPYTS
jgi:hypothetical protein